MFEQILIMPDPENKFKFAWFKKKQIIMSKFFIFLKLEIFIKSIT